MKVTTLYKHNFTYKRRTGVESQNEFMAYYMNTEHTSIVSKIAEDNSIDFETATAYAHAFYCALEDLFMFHCDIEMPNFDVSIEMSTGKTRGKIERWRESYAFEQKTISRIHDEVKANLEQAHLSDNRLAEKRLNIDTHKTRYSEEERKLARQVAIQKYIKSPKFAKILEKRKEKRAKETAAKLERERKERKRKKDKQRRKNKKAWRIKNEKWKAYCEREYFANL